jgi:hypothetical protein
VTRHRRELARDAGVVREVRLAAAGQTHHRGMVPVVIPQPIHAIDASAIVTQALDALRFVFTDQKNPARRCGLPRCSCHRRNDVVAGRVLHRLERVEAQAVEMVVADPIGDVLEKNSRTGPEQGPSKLIASPHSVASSAK